MPCLSTTSVKPSEHIAPGRMPAAGTIAIAGPSESVPTRGGGEPLAAGRLVVAARRIERHGHAVAREDNSAVDEAGVVDRAVAVGVEDADRAAVADAHRLAAAEIGASAARDVVDVGAGGHAAPRSVGARDLFERGAAQELVDDDADALAVARHRVAHDAVVVLDIDVGVVAERQPRLQLDVLVTLVVGDGHPLARQHLQDARRTVRFEWVTGGAIAPGANDQHCDDRPAHPSSLLARYARRIDKSGPAGVAAFARLRGPFRSGLADRRLCHPLTSP